MKGAGAGRKFGTLSVTIVSAKGLKEPLEGSAKDPYSKVRVGDDEHTTKVAVNGRTAPLFGEQFSFEIGKAGVSKDIHFDVWFKQAAGQDLLVGRIRTTYMAWVARGGFTGNLDLLDSKNKPVGKLSLKVNFERPVLSDDAVPPARGATVGGGAEEPPRDPAGRFSDAEIKEAFVAFDLDRNQFVGAAEIRHILLNIGEAATDEEVDEMIRMIDRDGDGQVSFDEFYEMVTGGQKPPPGLWGLAGAAGGATARRGGTAAPKAGVLRPGGGGAAPKIAERQARQSALDVFAKKNNMRPETIKKAYSRFQEGDKDSNGLITYSEFCEVLSVEPTPAVERLFSMFDKDGSGKVDIKEFVVGLSNFTGASKEEKLQFAFAVFDADNSGSISKEELTKILVANHLASSQEEVRRKADTIMMQADKDGNGVITFDEFVAVSKKFPNILYPAFSLGKKVQSIIGK